MGYDLSNSRRWIVPHGGEPREVLRVENAAGVIMWEKYYRVSYEANCDGMQYWVVYFNANGGSGSMSPLQVPKGSSVPLPACAFSRAGYALKAQQYNTAANGSGASYSAGESLTPTANMTLYAQWQANSYAISFNPGGGSGSMSPATAAYGSTVTLPACAFTRSGYVFNVWECTIDGEESYFEDQDRFVMPAQNLSLTAQWTNDTYTVTVSPGEGGEGGAGFTYYASVSSQTKTITPPTRTGYKITGWTFTGYTGATPSASGSAVTIPANTYGDITMTPTWSEDYITITFNSNEG